MGMTDAQFDSYKKMLLRQLEDAKDNNNVDKVVDRLIQDLKEELRKP